MDRFDLIQLFGNKACAFSNKLTHLVAYTDTCSATESWNFGLLLVIAAGVFLTARWWSARSKRIRNAYY